MKRCALPFVASVGAEADLPAERLLAAAQALAADREVVAHPGGDPLVQLDQVSNSS